MLHRSQRRAGNRISSDVAGVLPPPDFVQATNTQSDLTIRSVSDQWLINITDENRSSDRWAWKTGADLPNMSAVDKAVLAMHPDPRVRRMMADLPDMPLGSLMRLADDTDPHVRRAVAHRRDPLPVEVATIMVHDPDAEVTRALAARTDLDDPSLLAVLLGHQDVPTRAVTASHPALPDSLMDAAVGCDEQQVRVALASRPDLPTRVRVALANDDDAAVRDAVNAGFIP